ncbi:Tumor necrosis factor receptor superfamily member 6B Decoy receptor 3 [Channa argus]|uniref:Tumor necrosis factor receptor superfamily member 6B Decoy receptor 3 n=2 Tax=Channa argus TaxID=215402 RepID=A0A6G1QWB4_CHAAH|nr:Tumor necrosis factor receptor superfamily member 6B Decoy receptor 3 [Channa argus]
MMMLASLLPVLLLSVRTIQADTVTASVPTFKHTDPITGKSIECERCPPGSYLRSRCTSTQKTVCAPCPAGSFTALWNYIPKCLRCSMCSMNQVVKTACAADRDCQCQCAEGYYYKQSYDMCLRHSECPSGEGVLSTGTPSDDTVCQICPNGTFSSTVSAHLNCTEHKICTAAGLQLMLKGSVWHDSVCANCQNLKSRDGADYLKEILSSFFGHYKLNIKRLRRVVHHLEQGDKGATSELSLSDLHRRLDAWVDSATASKVRQLPEILKKVGADHASERLLSKLQRIEGNLNELCGLRNEVEGTTMSQN